VTNSRAKKRKADFYETAEKDSYRHDIWRSFVDAGLKEMLRRNKNNRVLLFPSSSGREIDVAISYGVPQDRILAVDKSAAIIARGPWRKKYPYIKCYGVHISRAAQRIKDDGFVLAAANLDFCNNFSGELIDEVSGFFDVPGLFCSEFLYGLTIAKGRESKATVKLLELINSDGGQSSEKRVNVLLKAASIPKSRLVKEGGYTNNRNPMFYSVFSLIDADMERKKKWEFVERAERELKPLADKVVEVDERYLEDISCLCHEMGDRMISGRPLKGVVDAKRARWEKYTEENAAARQELEDAAERWGLEKDRLIENLKWDYRDLSVLLGHKANYLPLQRRCPRE